MASASVGSVTEIIRNHDRTLRISRRFKAPRALVFKMFTDPAHLARWFGPEGHDVVDCTVESKVGGRFFADLKGPEGGRHRVQGVFKEVTPDRRVAFTWTWLDDEGRPRPNLATIVTIDLADHGSETELVLTHTGFENDDQQTKHNSGWNSCFVCLDQYLATLGA